MKRINKIIGIDQNYELSQNGLFVNLKSPNKTIKILSLDGISTFDQLNYSVYDIENTDHYVFFTLENESKSYSYDKVKKSINELPYILHIKGLKFDDSYLCFSEYREREVFLIIDLKTTQIVAELDPKIGFGNIQSFKNDTIISTKKKLAKIGRFNSENNQLWLLDLSDECSYDVGNGIEKGEISNIYNEDEFVYVLAGLSVIKVSIESGNIIWHSKLNTIQSRGIIQEGYLYTTSNAYINKIDCQTGEIIYEKNFDYIKVDGEKTLGPIKELTWYNEALWTIMDSNPSAIIKINPFDGSYKSVISLKELGITKACKMPRFYQDRMYLLDIDGSLHIFAMDAKC